MQISAIYWGCGRDIPVEGANVDKTGWNFKAEEAHESWRCG